MNTDKYNRAAYRQAVWKETGRLLRELYFPNEGIVPDLPCDTVFRAPREVPSEIFQEVLVALHKAERAEEQAMLKFRLEEMNDDQVRTLTGTASTEQEVSKQKPVPVPVPTRKKPARKGARKS